MTTSLTLLLLYGLAKGLDLTYRWVMAQFERPKPLRPLYKWEKIARRCLVAVMIAIMLVHDLLANQGLALRPNLNGLVTIPFLLSGLLWLSLALNRRFSKAWDWAVWIGTASCLMPATFFVWFILYLSSNGGEYDMVTEHGKTYLHTSEQESWSDHYVHKYEVVNDYLMKAKATDYDIHRLSERHYNLSYEEKHFSNEDTND